MKSPKQLRIHYLDPSLRTLRHLRDHLGTEAIISSSRSEKLTNSRTRYDIIIGGYPRPFHLANNLYPPILIIPYSGLPPETRAVLLEFPRIAVYRLPYNGRSTAEMAVALLMVSFKDILHTDAALRRGTWLKDPPIKSLYGRTVLILGYGSVGRHVADILLSFGMKVIVMRRGLSGSSSAAMRTQFITPNSFLHFLPQADAIISCLPLTPETKGLFSLKEMALVRNDATIVNVGRAEIFDEGALYNVLKTRGALKAAFDVWFHEPRSATAKAIYPSKFPFHRLPNVIMSPHRGGRADDYERQRALALQEFLKMALRGQSLPNRINVAIGY